MAGRYGVDATRLEGQKGIVEFLQDLIKRVEAGETGLRVGHTAIEDGNLVVRNGDIIVSESDDTIVLRILHGAVPELRFYPLGETDTHIASLFAFDASSDVDVHDQAIQLDIETVGGAIDGGKVLLTKSYAIFSHQPGASGGPESYIWLNADTVTPGIINVTGKWANQFQYNTEQALYMGSFVAGAGFTTWTQSYFSAFASTMYPVFTVGYSGATLQWVVDGQTSSSFTVRFSTTVGSKLVNFWNFRM